MTESEALQKMVAPGSRRPGKYLEGVAQIHVTRACDQACYGCTQGSNLGGKTTFMPPDLFERAVLSLEGYFGVVGVFGGNPALSPHFSDYCDVLKRHVPYERRGLWCNNPAGKGKLMRETFDPAVSNLNVHLDARAYEEFKRDWPECHPVGLHSDSRHSPPFASMKDLGVEEKKRWELISKCDINRHWSAMIGLFRGNLRAWFCEIAGAQSILHQDEPDYPDTGLDISNGLDGPPWWKQAMDVFADQVRHHCHDCGVPLKGYGELAQTKDPDAREQVSAAHQSVYAPKRKGRRVELVTLPAQLGRTLPKFTEYLQNSTR